ncbi:MAG TPA: nuclease-related domain-containing protein [Solirubrobacteraceae bacterium]|jgi:hypothetical protein|nr:nuclease-related domain-containing protein [Solirubrobacteraceae bacterium]
MSTNTTVEVYLGNPIHVASEREFLARLRHDLVRAGVSARVFANFRAGRLERQIDFVVITDRRVVQLDEKVFPGPIVDGSPNGPWTVRVGPNTVEEWRNPLAQALDATYALSDALHEFVAAKGAPGPTAGKFYGDIDTVVCAYPSLHEDSRVQRRAHVSVLGYDELLERLRTPGPALRWSPEDWDRFRRHLNLYREEEDSPEALVRHAGTAAVDTYLGLFLGEHENLPPLVPTCVQVDGQPAPRPDIHSLAAAGRAVLLSGGSGLGKTLWARHAAVELASAGHVPIWLAAEVCDESFKTAVARAVAPYTALGPNDLLRAADAAGRAVVFVVDDLSKAPQRVRRGLIAGAQTARLRTPGRGILVTAQSATKTTALPDLLAIELQIPQAEERLAILDGYGQAAILDRCEPFTTPLELALAAHCSAALPDQTTRTELLDIYVDRALDGDETRRAALRAVARRMHDELVPSLARPDVNRTLRRDHHLDDEQLAALLTGPLVRVSQGRAAFAHERYEYFLAAEALIADPDAGHLARILNKPVCAHLRADAFALESDEARLTEILSACEDPDVLVASVMGELGPLAERLADAMLGDTIEAACVRTTQPGVTFTPAAGPVFSGRWTLPDTTDAATDAQLAAIGSLVARGRYVEGVMRLLAATDEVCAAALEAAQKHIPGLVDQIFATTYALHGPGGIPAQIVMNAATDRMRNTGSSLAHATATALLHSEEAPGLGTLYLAAELLHTPNAPTDELPQVITRCLASGRYHLRLVGLGLAHDFGRRFDQPQRARVLDAVESLPSNNLMLNGMIVEALSALGGIEPARSLEDITEQIRTVLSMAGDQLALQMARGIVSSQFETEAIGPYFEAVTALDDEDREQLLTMALRGGETGMYDDWIISQFKDLSNPTVRAAVTDHIAHSDPSKWMMSSDSMRAIVAALRLLAADGQPVPEPAESGSSDPAWRAGLTVILDAVREREPTRAEHQATDKAWAVLTGDHRDTLAGLLSSLHDARWFDEQSIHDLVLAAMPTSGVDTLTWSLEHPNRLRSAFGHTWGARDNTIRVLADRGDRRAAQALRGFTQDPNIGAAAAAAVRAIETRINASRDQTTQSPRVH